MVSSRFGTLSILTLSGFPTQTVMNYSVLTLSGFPTLTVRVHSF